MSILKNLFPVVCVCIFFCACEKTGITNPGVQDTGGGPVIPYDSLVPVAGNWVLKYSDNAVGVHTDWWQDSTANGYRSWASHLMLLANDSAYWNSAGIDAIAVIGEAGTYFTSQDKSDTTRYLSFSFPINGVSVFSYSMPDKNTLLLNDLADTSTVYTYKRKL